jgi:hypothetical protein
MKILTKILLICGLVLTGVSWSHAQSPNLFTVRGKVVEAKDSSAVIGVTVAELGKDNRIVKGVTTDVEETSSLEFPTKITLCHFQVLALKLRKWALKVVAISKSGWNRVQQT